MIKEEPSAQRSASDTTGKGRSSRRRWADVWVPAALILVVAVPTLAVEEHWHGRPMIDQRTHLWILPVVLVVGAFLLGGLLAGYRCPSAAALHATAAAGVALGVLVAIDVARRLRLHEGVPPDVVMLWCFGVFGALVFSLTGSRLGRRIALGPR